MRFVPVVAANASDGAGNTWWRLNVTNLLPTVTNASTTIDGTAYSAVDGTTIVNTNVGQVGSGGTVGVNVLTLDRVNRPELEIRGFATSGAGITIDASSGTVRDLAINGFSASDGTPLAGAQIVVTSNSTAAGQAVISGNLIGTAADGTSPGLHGNVGGMHGRRRHDHE